MNKANFENARLLLKAIISLVKTSCQLSLKIKALGSLQNDGEFSIFTLNRIFLFITVRQRFQEF